MGKPKTFTVEVQITPVTGRSETKKVDVTASTTVKEVLAAAGVDPAKKKFLVDGAPADLGTKITSVSKVTVSEQPQGS
jgi:hypothetical protein